MVFEFRPVQFPPGTDPIAVAGQARSLYETSRGIKNIVNRLMFRRAFFIGFDIKASLIIQKKIMEGRHLVWDDEFIIQD